MATLYLSEGVCTQMHSKHRMGDKFVLEETQHSKSCPHIFMCVMIRSSRRPHQLPFRVLQLASLATITPVRGQEKSSQERYCKKIALLSTLGMSA